MGGFGSGRRLGWSDYTVEDCRAISAAMMMHHGLLRPNQHANSTVTWTDNETGEVRLAVRCAAETGRDSGTLRLQYARPKYGETFDYHIGLTTTPLPWGGLKWWFTCPLTKHEISCQRRVGKLYLLGRYFACRHCHELTYQSCQDSHKYDRCLDEVGAPMGLSGREVARRLNKRWKEQRKW